MRREQGLGTDIRFGLRMLAANPAAGLTALLALTIGIGSIAMVFSVLNGVLLRPLPYPEPESLITFRVDAEGTEGYPGLSSALIDALKEGDSFERIGQMVAFSAGLTGVDDMEAVPAVTISPDVLDILGAPPVVGRNFDRRDYYRRDAGFSSVLISYGLWQRRYSGDPGIVGRGIEIDNRDRTVIGILPEGFELLLGPESNIPRRNDIFVPPRLDGFPHVLLWRTVARLRPGVSTTQAQQEAQTIGNQVRRDNPQAYGSDPVTFHARSLHGDLVSDVRPAVFALLAASAFVLLIACLNVANLQMVRNHARAAELAIRNALGATRARIIRQIVTENLLLALVGGAGGFALAFGGLRLLPLLGEIPRIEQVSLDWRALLFVALVSFVCGTLFGLLPAWQASRSNLNDVLRRRGRGVSSHRLHDGLLVAEIAVALVLLVGAALLLRTFLNLQQVELGYNADNVASFNMTLDTDRYPQPADRWRFQRQMMRQLEELPGVQSAGGIRRLPLDGDVWTSGFAYDGESEREFLSRVASYDFVLPGYFETMGISLREGRTFSDDDQESDLLRIVVDEDLAHQAWPGQSGVGQSLVVDADFGRFDLRRAEVIGVVRHTRNDQIRLRGEPQIYLPLRSNSLEVVLRTNGELAGLFPAVRGIVDRLGSGRPVHALRMMDEIVAAKTVDTRAVLILLGALATAAMILSAVGAYGVLSHAVGLRTQEFGIRMAVGAARRHVLTIVLGNGVRLVLAAIPVGLLGSFVLSRWIERWLFGVGALDPATLVAAFLFLAAVALAACLAPALRAARLDPLVALRR